MLNGYHILTLTHRHAPLQAIGQAIVPDEQTGPALHRLKVRFNWDELYYLSTCNRVIYLFYTPETPSDELASQLLTSLRPELSESDVESLASAMELLNGAEAILHFLEVAASMDSLVIGEREIIRQLREAFNHCRAEELTGDHIRLLMRFTVETAKEIYSATGIGEKALSVVALAFNRMLGTGLGPDARILLIGAGQTNALFAKFLKKYGYRNVTVFNRSLPKATALAKNLNGNALPLDELQNFQSGFDALVVCTAATSPIITPELYNRLLAGETDRKVVIDLAIPNNVAREVVQTNPVDFIEIEDLRTVAEQNRAFREAECQKAQVMLKQKVAGFRELWHQRQVERALLPVVDDVRAAKNKALETVFSKEFEALDPSARELVNRMMDYLEKKSVASAMRTMKQVATQAGRHIAAGDQRGKPDSSAVPHQN